MTAAAYKPAHGGYPGESPERFPTLAVEDNGLGRLAFYAGDDAAQVDALAALLGQCYPGGSWSS